LLWLVAAGPVVFGARLAAQLNTMALASSRGPNPSSGCPGAHPAGAQAIPAEAPEVAGVELPTATTSNVAGWPRSDVVGTDGELRVGREPASGWPERAGSPLTQDVRARRPDGVWLVRVSER
jgi:hypothetical protein